MNANNKPKKSRRRTLSCVRDRLRAVVAPSAAAAAEVQHLPRAAHLDCGQRRRQALAQSATTERPAGPHRRRQAGSLEETGEFNGDEPVMLDSSR